jgi:hypothetical protein
MQTINNPLVFDGGMFYPGMFDDASKAKFHSIQPFCGAVCDAIHILRKANIDATLTQFTVLVDDEMPDVVGVITTREGHPVVTLRQRYKEVKGGKNRHNMAEVLPHIELSCFHVDLKDRGNANHIISTKTSYISKALKKKVFGIKNSVEQSKKAHVMGQAAFVVPHYADNKMDNPSRKNSLSVNTIDLTFLVDMMEGKRTYASETPVVQIRIDRIKDAVRKIGSDLMGVQTLIDSYFSMPKWIVSYHNGSERSDPYVTVGVGKIDCTRKGAKNHTKEFITNEKHDYEIEWLLPRQVYRSVEDFYALIGEEYATDLSLAIKTENIRQNSDVPFDPKIGIPSMRGETDLDTGVGYSRYGFLNVMIQEFICDCSVVHE